MITLDEITNTKSFNTAGFYRSIFRDNTTIRKFNELELFTGLLSTNALLFGCTNLEEVKLPALKSYGNEVFRSCKALKAIIMPEGVETIGDTFVYECNSLKYVELPSTITSIGSNMASRTDSAYTLVIKAVVPPTFGGFGWFKDGTVIYVPDNSVNAYKAADVWKNYEQYIKPLSEYVEEV